MKRNSKNPSASMLAITCAVSVSLQGCAPSQKFEPFCHPVNQFITLKKDEQLPALLPSDVTEKVDALMLDMMEKASSPVPGCGLAITIDDEIAYLKAYGHSKLLPNEEDFDLGTLSAIGSVSKTYTALAILRLMEAGKIANLGQTPTDFFDTGYPPVWDGAELRDFLSHTAGLRQDPQWDKNRFHDEASINYFFGGTKSPALKPLKTVQGFMHNEENMIGEPAYGSEAQPRYSNSGYVVLGAIVDSISQKLSMQEAKRGYEGYVWHEIARGNAIDEPASPAMCLGAGFRENPSLRVATGYHNGLELSLSDSSKDGWGWPGPAGGWWATIGDLARLMLVLQNDKIVSQASVKLHMRHDFGMLHPDDGADSWRVGMGLELSSPNDSASWYGKGGGIAGYSAMFRIWPAKENLSDTSLGIALMCNRRGIGDEVLQKIRAAVSTGAGAVQKSTDGGEGASPMQGGGVESVRRILSAYAGDGWLDPLEIAALHRDISRSPVGKEILQAAEEGRWTDVESLVEKHLRKPEKTTSR